MIENPRRMMIDVLALMAAFAGTGLAGGSALAETPPGPGFIDITRACGVDAVIDAHYQRVPKWWLSGTNLVDLDGDGHLDLFLGAHGQSAAVALNDGHGRFRDADPVWKGATEIHVACDIAGEGKLSLQLTHGDGGGRWFRNQSAAGSLRFEPKSLIAPQGRENAMIDIDRDGRLDWIHEDARDPSLVFELGDGKGGFARGPTVAAFRETSAVPVDLNGDGRIDLVLKQCGYHSEKEGRGRIMMNDGEGQFVNRTAECGLVEEGLTIQGVGDLDQDGAPDLICLEHGKTLAIYLNDGKGKFTKLEDAASGMEQARKPAYANWGLAVIVDFDNDGIPDVLMNGRNFLYLLRGTGGGKLAYMNKQWKVPDFSWGTVDEGLCFGDIDGDGRLDLVVSSGSEKQKRMSVLRNELPQRRWLNVRVIGAAGNRPAAGARIRLLEPGTGKLLACEQVIIAGRQTALSYYELGTTERHFGLGDRASVDVRVEFYPSGKIATRQGVKADQAIEVRE